MATLDTIDTAAPAGAAALSGGDEEIRGLKDMLKNSFGGTDAGAGTALAEHFLKGMHKFPNGTEAAKPAAGNAGRIYLNTERRLIERDTGAAWNILGALKVYTMVGTANLAVAADQTVATVANVIVPPGGIVFVAGLLTIFSIAAGSTVTAQIFRGATDVTLFTNSVPPRTTAGSTNDNFTIPTISYEAPAAGTYTYTLKSTVTGNIVTAQSGSAFIVVA